MSFVNFPESVTEKLPLIGADGYFALMQQIERICDESGGSRPLRIFLTDMDDD